VFDTTTGAHATYESAKGTWVPSNTSARHFRDQARKRRAEVETHWRQQNELARLRVENDELKRRLAKLERILYSPGNLDLKLRGSEPPQAELNPSIPRHGPTPHEEAGSEAAGSETPKASADGAEQPSETSQEPESAGEAPPAEPSSVPPPAPAFDPFEVPPPNAFERCIATLVGSDVELEPPDGDTSDLSEFFGARLVSDDDELRGVMLANLEAVARMGGLLLMLPEPEVLQQIASGAPSQDSLEAMSEVFNTLTAEFNHVAGNPHVRSRPLGPVDPEDLKWFKYARNRVEFKLPEGGLLVMLAR
ncbi:MAG: hypothetical protein AB7K71_32640, partial [Polyangiaceae bacterium]